MNSINTHVTAVQHPNVRATARPSLLQWLTTGLTMAAVLGDRWSVSVQGLSLTPERALQPLSAVDALLDPSVVSTLRRLNASDPPRACSNDTGCHRQRVDRQARLHACEQTLVALPPLLADRACWQLQDDVAALSDDATLTHVTLPPRNSFNTYGFDVAPVQAELVRWIAQELNRAWRVADVAVLARSPARGALLDLVALGLARVGGAGYKPIAEQEPIIYMIEELPQSAPEALRRKFCLEELRGAGCNDLTNLVGLAHPFLDLLNLYVQASVGNVQYEANNYFWNLFTWQHRFQPTWARMAANAHKGNSFVQVLQGGATRTVSSEQFMAVLARVAHEVGEWLTTLRAFIHEFAKTDSSADVDVVERFLGETTREGVENLQRYVWRKYAQHYISMGEQANHRWPNLTKVMIIKQEYVATVRGHFMLQDPARPA